MALWDLYGQLYRIPVYKLMGGARKKIVTDITISVNDPEEMARDAVNAVERGYDCLKVKVGANPELDVARLAAVRKAAGEGMQMGAADLVNIKLMKCGGLWNALKIASAAEVYGVECMCRHRIEKHAVHIE